MVPARMPGVSTVERMGVRMGVVVAVGNIPCYMEMWGERLHEQQQQHDADDDAAPVLFPESHERICISKSYAGIVSQYRCQRKPLEREDSS